MKKLLGRIGNCIIILIVLLCLPLAVPKAVGIQEYNVISGSMEPEIPIGSIVYVKPAAFAELAQGDVIAFDVGASIVTHRIVSIDKNEKQITTKGDANNGNDIMPVAYDNVRGKVVANYPFIGNIAGWLSTIYGKLVAGILLVVGVILSTFGEKKTNDTLSELENNISGKTDKKRGIKPLFILILGLVIVTGSVAGFGYISWGYQKSEEFYDSIERTYVVKHVDDVLQVPWQEMIAVDIKALQSAYPDVAGWLYVEGTDISYPIVFSGDDETYLRATIDKEYATAGSIFLEGYNLPDFSDSHNIIYGHNMRNRSMFGTLKDYKTIDYFYDEHRYFQIITPSGKLRFEIFSYFDTEPGSWVYTVPYYDNPEYQAYIGELNNHSLRNAAVASKVSSADKIVTLSTCSSQGMRFTVHGYLCDSAGN